MNPFVPAPIIIEDCYDDGTDSRHFTFAPLAEPGDHHAAAGQFLMLTVPGHGDAAFTYSSLPDERGRFSILVRKAGGLTTALFELGPAAVLGYRGPFGKGWPVAELKGKSVLVVAGGCGLAPLAALIDILIPTAKLTLIYGAHTAAARVLNRQRQRWQDSIRLIETADLPADGLLVGSPVDHIDQVINELSGKPEAVLCCGPEGLMHAVAAKSVAHGLAAERIWLSQERRMHCGLGGCGHCYLLDGYVCTTGPTYRWDQLEDIYDRMAPRTNSAP